MPFWMMSFSRPRVSAGGRRGEGPLVLCDAGRPFLPVICQDFFKKLLGVPVQYIFASNFGRFVWDVGQPVYSAAEDGPQHFHTIICYLMSGVITITLATIATCPPLVSFL